jgi:predicted transcriptional regulator
MEYTVVSEPIELRSELHAFLEQSAQQAHKSVSDVMNEALEYYFQAKQEEKISQEIEAYEAMHSELWQKLPYQWVAIHNQTLVDHDTDDVALFRRLRARYGRVSILLRQVRETPNPEIWIRTPSTGKLQP